MRALLLLSCFIITVHINAQNQPFCATDEMHQHVFDKHPEYNPGIIRAHEKLETFTQNFVNSVQPKSNNPYIIPVVFHVIHNYGPENISEAQIFDGIEQANIQLRKLNADTTDIVAAFEGIAADAEIELRLARLDPDGNCTNGITRTVSPLTNIGDHQVKSLIQWPPDQYLNIYVCNQAAGLAGHAMLPAAADTVPEWDGIVMQHSYVGTIGTSDYFRRTVLTHEIGHYLNLQHIWGGNNVPNYYYLPVAQSGNCDFDDDVADTPNTIGWQSCNLNSESCGDLDNVQNYMDYAYCARMFTEGQKSRMHACLNSSVAGRNNLWTTANLEATGTDGTFNELCAANISADKKIVCAGEPVEFSDLSYYNVTSRSWEFTGADVQTSTDSSVIVTYSQPGTYDVKITVSDGNTTIEEVYEEYITIFPSVGNYSGLNEGFEWGPSFESRFVITDKEKSTNWEISTPGYMSNQSIMINNYDGPDAGVYSFISKPIDISNLSDLTIRFDAAFARYNSNNNSDILRLKISNDCGETWLTRRTLFTSTLVSVNDTVAIPFVPNDETEWKEHAVSSIPSQYYVDNLIVMLEYTAGGGNNVYVDNIQIGHPDELSTINIGIKDKLTLYPNPAKDFIVIEGLDESLRTSINIFNSQGKIVRSNDTNKQSKTIISTENLPKGIYTCQVKNQNGVTVKKFVIL
jgi:PKD repeat protein